LAHLKKHEIDAVGHRVVHGGARFQDPVCLNDGVITEIDQLSELAPLHNPPCLAAIHETRAQLGADLPMVAVFDTAFHATMPKTASTYAIPHDLAIRYGIRRYGFHGIAHGSMANSYAELTGTDLLETKLITLHLGNGCSAAAIKEGRSIDTSMGLTPLEGLVMGTRSGDLDPAVMSYVCRKEQVDAETVERWLNERSGLLGVSGLSNDVRLLLKAEAEGNTHAALALDLFCHRARKYIGAYLAVLSGADTVIFGGGIGEHAAAVRTRICQGMEWCGLRLDPSRNEATIGLSPGAGARISRDDARLAAYVIAVDEETWIARETLRCLHATDYKKD
jgi:acetate kinase